ncbi:MAG: MarR family winged helix-turn-helix transcriptional regulator [Pseudomonadota bacterium]|uniref:MarR family winged helix-turn-helix transcriptional regulator n=1 Tax=Fodinicurvata fenggangensis TaxID=1121830 RepID=UPI00138DF5FC|nr:MarR family transcriptional regulator [Fodinicurvata fenggangensis]
MDCDSYHGEVVPKNLVLADSNDSEGTETALWNSLSTCHSLIAAELRLRLRQHYSMTLPRYEAMAELSRHEEGLPMGELSRRLMVSNGNITGITDRLVADGLVSRHPDPSDRRTHFIKLTRKGRESFDRISQSYNSWLGELLDGISAKQSRNLENLLQQLQHVVNRRASIGP